MRERLEAVRSGEIAAASLMEPWISVAQKQGFRVIIESTRGPRSGMLPAAGSPRSSIMAEAEVKSPAVIILDMANGYGWKPGSFGYDMVARVRRLKDAAYAANVPVVHVNSMRRPTDHLPGPSNMVPGSEAVQVIQELQPVDRDILIYKRYLSGFSHNDLDYTLRTMGVDAVLIAGASTDNTVLWTSADAFQNRYKVVLVEDCTMVHRQQEPPGAQECAVRIIRQVLHGEILSLEQAIAKYLKTP